MRLMLAPPTHHAMHAVVLAAASAVFAQHLASVRTGGWRLRAPRDQAGVERKWCGMRRRTSTVGVHRSGRGEPDCHFAEAVDDAFERAVAGEPVHADQAASDDDLAGGKRIAAGC